MGALTKVTAGEPFCDFCVCGLARLSWRGGCECKSCWPVPAYVATDQTCIARKHPPSRHLLPHESWRGGCDMFHLGSFVNIILAGHAPTRRVQTPLKTLRAAEHTADLSPYSYIYVYIYICSPPLRHAKMHILPVYPQQFLGERLRKSKNPKIQNPKNLKIQKFQKSKNLKIQKTKNPKIQKKLQDSVDVKSFGFLQFWIFRFLDFGIF